MRRTIVALLLVLGACKSGGSRTPAGQVGADGPRQAAAQFMSSIKSEDIQATSIIWGSAKGPARELITNRGDLEKRILVMQCNLNHDTYRILSELPGEGNKRVMRLEIRKGQITAQTTMTATPGPNQRWFIENTDLQAMRGFCSNQATEPKK